MEDLPGRQLRLFKLHVKLLTWSHRVGGGCTGGSLPEEKINKGRERGRDRDRDTWRERERERSKSAEIIHTFGSSGVFLILRSLGQ